MRCADYPAGRIAGLDQSGGWHASPSVSRLNLDGGSEKWGHYGREKGASDVVTLWPAAGETGPDVNWRCLQVEWFSADFAFSAR